LIYRRRLRAHSSFIGLLSKYLERRFGKTTRLAASLSYTAQMVMYMGIVLFAPSLALEALTGLNRSYSILIVGAVCTFYSTIGGMKAVLLTDVFQSILMYAAVLAILISGLFYADGFGNIFKAADDGDRLELWKQV
jgi:solute carrier family 5 (sodium-coupled monocarboxylate transporter), member 8/12